MLAGMKKLEIISRVEDVEKGCELTKEKFPEELDPFDQFEESHWEGFRKDRISTCLNSGVSRTNDARERQNRHFNDDFTFRKLTKTLEFLQN